MTAKKKETAFQDSPEGRYVNYFKVGHNADVFVIDYFQYFPEDNDANTGTRIGGSPHCRLITSPNDAKQLLLHLESSIKLYESAYGAIQNGKS